MATMAVAGLAVQLANHLSGDCPGTSHFHSPGLVLGMDASGFDLFLHTVGVIMIPSRTPSRIFQAL